MATIIRPSVNNHKVTVQFLDDRGEFAIRRQGTQPDLKIVKLDYQNSKLTQNSRWRSRKNRILRTFNVHLKEKA
jgi:hypothetical protein